MAPARLAFALAMIAGGEAGAQSAVQGVPNAMQGFSQNRDQPIQIEAATLEMRDKKKEATFSGNVKVVQGDTTMTSKTLVVFYEFELGPARRRRRPNAQGGAAKVGADAVRDPRSRRRSSIKRLEAKGNVVVTQKDQVVTGETAVFDTKTNLITMLGGRGPDPGQERAAWRPAAGGHDDGRVAGRIRLRAGAGPVSIVRPEGGPLLPGAAPAGCRPPGAPNKPK